jgi:hypothetical protein
MHRPSVKRVAAILITTTVTAWLAGMFVVLREAGGTLSTVGGNFGVGPVGDGVSDVRRRGTTADPPSTEAARPHNKLGLAPSKQPGDLSARSSIWRCSSSGSTCKRFQGEAIDVGWSAAAEGQILQTLAATKPLHGETFDVACRTTVCAIKFAFRLRPGVQYVHYLTTQEDAGWGETVAGWITEDRERIDYFEINSWFHDRAKCAPH